MLYYLETKFIHGGGYTYKEIRHTKTYMKMVSITILMEGVTGGALFVNDGGDPRRGRSLGWKSGESRGREHLGRVSA